MDYDEEMNKRWALANAIPEHLTVEYYDIDAGWIEIRLKAGDRMYEERMSEVFDPLPDLKRWLEAIAIGVRQTSFTFDNEGNFIKFDFERINADGILEVIWNDGETIEFHAKVVKTQLVEAFYCGMMNMFESAEYDPHQWEWKAMHKQLCQMLDMNYDELVNHCLKLDKQGFAGLLTQGKTEAGGWNIPVGDWDLPDNYDTLKIEEKKPVVAGMLNRVNVNPYHGTSKDEFKSEIIEHYLNHRPAD
jgi:hypothetical protein